MTSKWINITDLMLWGNKPYTGIQRTEFELIKYFLRTKRFKFFYFELSNDFRMQNSFIELTHEEVQLILDRNTIRKEHIKDSDQVKEFGKSKLYKMVNLFIPKFILDHIPKQLIIFFSKVVRASLHKIRQLKKKILEKNKSVQNEKDIQIFIDPFEKDETIFLIGGEWNYRECIIRLRELTNIKNLCVVGLIYDIIPVTHPQFFEKKLKQDFEEYLKILMAISSKIITISNSTRNDLINYCENNRLKGPVIEVFRLGDKLTNQNIFVDREFKFKSFIVCVGTIEIRKNHLVLYQAYKILMQNVENTEIIPDLFIIGKRGWLSTEICHLIENDPEIKNKIHIIDNCTDDEMIYYYQNCLFTIYPSFYEGWGLPVAESIYYGKFCLATNSSSIPEVADGLIDYFNPFDPPSLASLILKYYQNKELIIEKEQNIKNNYIHNDWESSAKMVESFLI